MNAGVNFICFTHLHLDQLAFVQEMPGTIKPFFVPIADFSY